MKQKILIIDDDFDLCRLLKDNLEQEGYYVCTCYDGITGLKESQSCDYQLVVLDIMLPLKNGYEVLEKIREKSVVPVLMLTAKDSEGDKVAGLRMGADDYLTKPFANSEFLARVSSLLRRYTVFNTATHSDKVVVVGRLMIDKSGREVRKDALLIALTAKEFDLLLFFAENPGQVFTKKQIYRAVWQDEYAFDDNNIMVHIRRLRKKIEDNPEDPKYILTVWGVGYKFGGGLGVIMLNIVFALISLLGFGYILRIRKQLSEWLRFLKSVHKTPERNFYVKGNDILADINFELNDILEERHRQFVKLQRAEAANQQLLTDLSHDVRTPLVSLIGYLEALDAQTAKDKTEYIHVAYRKALDLQELTDMLFQWFQLASDEQTYQMKDYDINELTRELMIEHIPIFEKNQISFSVNIPDDEWVIRADRMAYARILNNLLSNAMKHGKCSQIEIRIEKSKDRVQVLVENDGRAIPKDEIPFIFDRLYKCDAACTEHGNGLGLAIVRELTNAMSGDVDVQSIEGGKTVFCLSLPLNVRKN